MQQLTQRHDRVPHETDSIQPHFAGQSQPPRIAVVGDIMIDVDLHCRCDRLCQEGPWPVFAIERTERRMGGAGNVAEMTLALGARTMLLGLIGQSESALPIDRQIEPGWHAVIGETTTKTRHHINGRLTGPRLDQDLAVRPGSLDIQMFLEQLDQFRPDTIIVADHGKGMITRELMESLGRFEIPIYVDPISTTPLIENGHYAAIAGSLKELPPNARCVSEVVIEKQGPDGLMWTSCQPLAASSLSPEPSSLSLPSTCRTAIDPLGAGDQFIATLAYMRCIGVDWPEAIHTANIAAGMQCERPGCVPITAEELLRGEAMPHWGTLVFAN